MGMDVSEYLETTGMTLVALSRATSIGYDTIWKAKHGLARMKVETAEKLVAFDSRMTILDLLQVEPSEGAKAKKGRAA